MCLSPLLSLHPPLALSLLHLSSQVLHFSCSSANNQGFEQMASLRLETFRNITAGILACKLPALSPAVPLAIVAYYFTFQPTWVFSLSLLGLALLAERVNFLTEKIAYRTGPREQVRGTLDKSKVLTTGPKASASGLLIATFGNIPELIVAIFALHNHKIDVVKYSLLGSITSNLLLVLGASLGHGGIVKLQELQKYNKRQARVNCYMLLMALFCHLLPMPFRNVNDLAPQFGNENLSLSLSLAGSVTMLIVYFGNLIFQLRKAGNQSFEALDETRVLGLWSEIMWLVVLVTFMVLLSKYVVETIEDASNTLGLSVYFLSIILLPIVGNVGRHNGAITSAFQDNLLDISMSVALDSATHISTFTVPLCVTIAWLMDIKMDLNFNLLGTGFLTSTIVATTFPLQGWLPSFPLRRNSGESVSLDFSLFSFKLRF